MPQVNPKAFRDGYEPRATDVFIAIMGVTGAGKSTLISKCTEKQVRIGSSLQACTQEVEVFLCKYNESVNVYLVDTPGFDDTERSDTDILTEIASWLVASYSNAIKLHGIIYLHRITDPRMQGAAMRNLHMFQKLCGTRALNNVVLATTMWDDLQPPGRAVAAEREHQLKTTQKFWGYMLDHGSQIFRHYNNRESAIGLIGSLLDHATAEPKVVLDIQAQMVDHGKSLADTSAGQAVDDVISKKRAQVAEDIANMQAGVQEAIRSHDKGTVDMLNQHKSEMDERIKRLDNDSLALKVGLERLQEQRFAKMQKALENAELEGRRAREAMVAAELEQERRRKELEDAVKMQVEMVAAQKKQIAELQSKAEEKHKQEMAELEERLGKVAKVKSRVRSHPGINTMYLWSVSVSLWADKYFFVAMVTDMSVPTESFPAARLGPDNGNREVALGEGGAYYIHYHDAAGKCWTERSPEFLQLYADAESYMKTNEQYGCPSCISLGHGGHYFLRTAWGCSYKVPPDAKAHLVNFALVENFWFGANGAWVATKYGGDRSWDLKDQYPGLAERIRDGLKGETTIMLVAMNPEDEEQWVILWRNGLAAYNIGKKNVFDNFDLEEWCTKNFGTIWNSA